jgi:hypothetical protein
MLAQNVVARNLLTQPSKNGFLYLEHGGQTQRHQKKDGRGGKGETRDTKKSRTKKRPY